MTVPFKPRNPVSRVHVVGIELRFDAAQSVATVSSMPMAVYPGA